MKNAKGMTFSADGTGHRSINYNSRHVHLLVENYASKSSDNNTKQQATRTFGIQSSLVKWLWQTGKILSRESLRSLMKVLWESALAVISNLWIFLLSLWE